MNAGNLLAGVDDDRLMRSRIAHNGAIAVERTDRESLKDGLGRKHTAIVGQNFCLSGAEKAGQWACLVENASESYLPGLAGAETGAVVFIPEKTEVLEPEDRM